MNDSLTEALHTVSHRCLGRRLKPFTLGHAVSLSVAESPFYTHSEEEITRDHLNQAVEICSRPWDFFQRGKQPGYFRRLLWQRRNRKADLETETLRFRLYLVDHCSGPEMWRKEDGKPLQVDSIFSLVAGLMTNLGKSEPEAWQTAPGRAQWLTIAAAELNPFGDVHLVSDEDRDARELLHDDQRMVAATEELKRKVNGG